MFYCNGFRSQLVNFLLFCSSLAAYGAYVRPMPYANEIGLRMLIGGVVREAAVLGYHVTPLFSYYAFHGPVFRVLLRLNRGKIHDSRYCIIVSVLTLAFHFFVCVFLFDCYVFTLSFITFVTMVGIMVTLGTATSVEIPMSFLGINLVR